MSWSELYSLNGHSERSSAAVLILETVIRLINERIYMWIFPALISKYATTMCVTHILPENMSTLSIFCITLFCLCSLQRVANAILRSFVCICLNFFHMPYAIFFRHRIVFLSHRLTSQLRCSMLISIHRVTHTHKHPKTHSHVQR